MAWMPWEKQVLKNFTIGVWGYNGQDGSFHDAEGRRIK